MEMSDQLHAPAALPPEEEPPLYPLDRRLDEPQIRSGHGGEEKKFSAPAGNRILEFQYVCVCVCVCVCPMHTTCSAYLILLDLITLIIGVEYKL
jgi:hypothetical protein